jgi:signal transduction histidine kinase
VRIATRLTILFVVLIIVVTFTVGWFAVAMSSRSQYASLDSEINSVVDSGLENSNTALSDALYVVQRESDDLTLDVIFPSGEITRVNSGSVTLRRSPTIADVKNSLTSVVSEANLPGFVIRSLNVGGGDYLVVAGSTSNIKKQNQHLSLVVALVALVIALLGLALARLVIRRDLKSMERLIHYAGDVTNGDEVGPMPAGEGSRDLEELRAALVIMVDALQERIALETRSTQAMQQFIGDASHELRTPLTVVKGYNEMLANGTASPEQQVRAVERIKREVERMEELVRDLLLLAEVREAPRHAERIVNLDELLVVKVADFGLENPGHVLTSEIQSHVAILARVDFVERLISNALTNVVRHTPGNAPLRVVLRSADQRVELLFEDGGPGLPYYGVRPQRFQRFDDSRSRETGGSGLGMSIMADVAEQLGGSLVTERSSLGGLALRFELPLAPPSKP